MTRRRLLALLAAVALALAGVWAILGRSRPIPEVVLPPIYVPRPIPENCEIVFGEIGCFDPALLTLMDEHRTEERAP